MDPAEEIGKSTVEHWDALLLSMLIHPEPGQPGNRLGLPGAWRARRVNTATALHAGHRRATFARDWITTVLTAQWAIGGILMFTAFALLGWLVAMLVPEVGFLFGQLEAERRFSWTMPAPSPISICRDTRWRCSGTEGNLSAY